MTFYSNRNRCNNAKRQSTRKSPVYFRTRVLLTGTLVSGQFYLRLPSQDPVLLNSHTNSVFLHSRKGPAALTTPFSRPEGRPEGVHLQELPLYCFNILLSFHRFSKQYSKDYKAKEVSEGGETKDFWNVLGGKANFMSLSEGECCDALQKVIPPVVH